MEEEKRVIAPTININHNEKDTGLRISVNLAGASKGTVELEMGKEGLCVKGEGEDANMFWMKRPLPRSTAPNAVEMWTEDKVTWCGTMTLPGLSTCLYFFTIDVPG
ncbi:MAG: hypothetical protein P8017_12725 [Deltaproteobacteria bacterium]